ncbi:MAG: ABC transporter substrate-binding protein [Candidatus Dadabacteria bacterium]|nr:ABC transporter substrate-binding protein [Candidatus Dadabacteria bacterium]
MRKVAALLFFAVVAAVAVLGLVSCHEDSDEEVAVGVAFPLTGVSEGLGGNMKKGVELAVEEINASALLGGMDLRLVFEDTEGTPDGAERAFRKLLGEDAVSAVIGPWSSSSTRRIAPLVNESNVVAISPTSAASPSGITAPGDFIFRTSLTVDKMVPEGVKETKGALKYSKAATIVNIDDAFSMSSNDKVLEELAKCPDVEVVEEQSFSRAKNDSLPDLTEQLRAIRDSGADVIFVSALSPGRQGVIVKAREMGITVPLIVIGLTETDVAEAEKVLRGATEGVIAVTNWVDDSTPRSVDFVGKYKAKYEEDPDAYSARSYASTQILAAAIVRASTASPEDIRAALQMIGPESALDDTIFGKFYFDENGDGVYSPVVRIVRGGKFEALQ